jgi:phosphomannomutase/phosphoglucomutase
VFAVSVFRAYDIRGIYPSEVNEDFAEKIGKAFGTFMNGGKIAVAGDVRTSTPSLKKKLVEGLISTGAEVVDIGMAPTPVLYFAVASQNLDGGVVVTASHNTKEYNGFKIVGKDGVCLSWETCIKELKGLFDSGEFKKGEGNLKQTSVDEAYTKHVLSKVKINKKLKIVIDPANGACSLIAPKIFQRLGCEVVCLFCEPDGNFPNHEADPIKKENLKDLQKRVKEEGADLGLGFDGDGDRLGVVDENGEIVENHTIFSLFIKDVLGKKPKSRVIYEVVVSKVVEDTIKKYGGIPILMRVGHSYIQEAMNAKNAALGGENSGHYYFPENYGYDDSIFAGLKVAELVNKAPLSERKKEIPDYISSEEFRPFCTDEKKFKVVSSIQEKFRKEKMIDIDGARVVFNKGWFIIRASNTGPQLVVRWEAEDKEEYERIGSIVKDTLSSMGVKL